MFDSMITANDLIRTMQADTDLVQTIRFSTWLGWLNAAEQLLYSETIGMRERAVLPFRDGCLFLSDVTPLPGAAQPAAQDVVAVVCEGHTLSAMEEPLASALPQCDSWRASGNRLVLHLRRAVKQADVIYLLRPALKTVDEQGGCNQTVSLPAEWLPMISAKLRGEAYRLVNEDALAAKWLEDYNAKLSDFRRWLARRRPMGGSYGV